MAMAKARAMARATARARRTRARAKDRARARARDGRTDGRTAGRSYLFSEMRSPESGIVEEWDENTFIQFRIEHILSSPLHILMQSCRSRGCAFR